MWMKTRSSSQSSGTPLGSCPSFSSWKNTRQQPSASTLWPQPYPQTSGVKRWEASSLSPSSLFQSKANISFADSLSQHRRRLKPIIEKKNEELHFGGQDNARRDGLRVNKSLAPHLLGQDLGRMQEGWGVVWVGPVGCDSRPSGPCVCQLWQHPTVGQG